MATNQPSDDLFNEKNEAKRQWVYWGKEGDWFKGTLVSKTQVESTLPGKEGELVWNYEFKMDSGEFHMTDEKTSQPIEPGVKIEKGEYYMVGGRAGIDKFLNRPNIKPGQIIGMRFIELVPPKTKGFNAFKNIKVYIGDIDTEYLGETGADILGDADDVQVDDIPFDK